MSAETALKMHDEYSDVFTGIWCFKGTLFLQVKDDTKPYKFLLHCVAYALQEPFKKELERLQQHQILASLDIDEIAEWYNTFVMVPKPNGTECLCQYTLQDLTRLK